VRCKGNKILQLRLASGSEVRLASSQDQLAVFHQHAMFFDTDEVNERLARQGLSQVLTPISPSWGRQRRF
jgi:hypothetical protein